MRYPTLHPIVLLLLIVGFGSGPVAAQVHPIEVLVTIVEDKVVALPGGGSPVEEALGVNESIVTTAAKGPAGFVQTSRRLLGFSSALHRWTEVQLDVEEHVEQHQTLPRLVIVHTNRRIHGFQESRGHWFSEALGPNETVTQLRGRGHVMVVVTSERALAISAFTGGFFWVRLSPNELVQSIDHNNDAAVVRTTARQLAFRSQAGFWTEMR
ncbi:MAG: hypothetical protein IPM58_00175 [Nitrospira sp.]|nr:hypothetical protein [Nitrospira sp.]